MSKSIQLKDKNNEKFYPHPYYPVGSIYLSVNNTNPSKWFGGTWVQIAKGRTLVGVDTNDADFNTVQKTGGEKKHTLNISEMPNHRHQGVLWNSNGWGISFNAGGDKRGYGLNWEYDVGIYSEDNIVTKYTGGGQAHNNLQPYFTCYIWCRTA